MKINHYIGGILLVSGTTIGAGMLVLPVLSSFVGFIPSTFVFVLCWLVMLTTAFFFLDVNFFVGGEVNFITMVHRTLGTWGKVVSWVFYLCLLYSLSAAYIAASGPLLSSAFYNLTGCMVPVWFAPFFLPIFFGGFVYLGTSRVDFINRILMLGLGVSYLVLIIFLPEHIEGKLLLHIDWNPTLMIFPFVITSFGYHIIIPSLTTYMNHDKKKIKRVLVLGSLIPLVIYVLWLVLILGVIPIKGDISLVHAWQVGAPATQPLATIIKNKWIQGGAQAFSFFAIVTSFLGISLSLADFLLDGLKIKKNWKGRAIACLLTFTPPVVFVFVSKKGFFKALEYAGAFVAILLIFLPSMMVWKLKKPRFYSTLRGRFLIIIIVIFSIFILIVDILDQWEIFKPFIQKYIE